MRVSLTRTAARLLLAAATIAGLTRAIGANAGPEVMRQPDMFAESAAYERFMGRWSRLLAPPFVTFVGIGPTDAVLDVGSGTGVLALTIAQSSPSARIVGIDPAAPYVKFAQSRVTGDRVRFEVGDAQKMTFADATFDRVLSLLVLNFIPDRDKALDEMIRVAKPGGIVGAVVWDYGGEMEMLRAFWDEAVARDPSIEKRDERHMPLCRSGELGALWRGHGLRQVVEQPLTFTMTFTSFDDYWTPFLGGQGPAGAYVAKLPEGDRAALAQRLRKRLLGGRADGAIALQARAWAVRGIK
jgi:SAM-dependent methyltransferase